MSLTTKKIVLITGCSAGGIGDALAREFHNKGIRVIATARDVSTMQSLAALGIETMRLDVTDPQNIEEVKSRISDMCGGKLDVLINNAGIPCAVPATDVTLDLIKMVYEVNVFGPMMMVKAFVPLLIASGDGRIVQMGTLAGTMPFPFSPVYNSSKAALHSYGDTLRVELAPFKVKVITVAAGNVKSNIMLKSELWQELPPDSLYKPVQDEFQKYVDHMQDGATPARTHAQKVVSETLRPNPRAWLYSGKNAWPAWLLGTFGGRRAFDGPLSRRFGLAKLSKILAGSRSSAPP